MLNRDSLRPGTIVKHFKGKLYQIITIAKHTETDEEMVVYQALYDEFGVFVRPYSMFVEKVDAIKYPDVSQEYRFELWEKSSAGVSEYELTAKTETVSENNLSNYSSASDARYDRDQGTEQMLRFLDAGTCQEKWDILMDMGERLNGHMLNNISASLDLVIESDDFSEQLEMVKDYLRARIRFEDNRRHR